MFTVRVIHLTPHFYWPQLEQTGWPIKFDTMGGMQNQIFRQVHFLDNLGNVKQLILTLKIPGISSFFSYSKNLEIISRRIPLLPIRSRIRGMVDLNISWLLGVLSYILINKQSLKNKYDIIHTHASGVGLPLLCGYISAKMLNLPLVISVHCSAIATYKPMNFYDIFLHKLNIKIEKFVLDKATSVIFLTKSSLDKCASYVPSLKFKSTIITDSIDSKSFLSLECTEGIKNLINQHKIPTNKPICVYVGRIAKEKGWREIIYLAKELKDIYQFLIVGDGNELDLMKNIIKKNKLEEHFTFTGYIPQSQVPNAMSLASVLILPSKHEEFGSVLLESMTMGLVSIAYNVGGVSNVITHNKNGFLVSNREEMKEYLINLLNNKKLQDEISSNAKKAVNSNFQLNVRVHEILNVYRNIIHAKHKMATSKKY